MGLYIYACKEHGEIEVNKKMSEATNNEYCPFCNEEMERVFFSAPSIWKTDGNFGRSKGDSYE